MIPVVGPTQATTPVIQLSNSSEAPIQGQVLSSAGSHAVTGDNFPTKATSSVTNASAVGNYLNSDAHSAMLYSPGALQGMPMKLRGDVGGNNRSPNR